MQHDKQEAVTISKKFIFDVLILVLSSRGATFHRMFCAVVGKPDF